MTSEFLWIADCHIHVCLNRVIYVFYFLKICTYFNLFCFGVRTSSNIVVDNIGSFPPITPYILQMRYSELLGRIYCGRLIRSHMLSSLLYSTISSGSDLSVL